MGNFCEGSAKYCDSVFNMVKTLTNLPLCYPIRQLSFATLFFYLRAYLLIFVPTLLKMVFDSSGQRRWEELTHAPSAGNASQQTCRSYFKNTQEPYSQ